MGTSRAYNSGFEAHNFPRSGEPSSATLGTLRQAAD